MSSPDQGADDSLVGTDHRRVLRLLGSQRVDVDHSRGLVDASGFGRQAHTGRGAHRGRRRQRAAAEPAGRNLFRGRVPLRIPQRSGENRGVAQQARLGNRRLSRRRRLLVPDRPAPPHDHLRRREHLPAGGGEPLGRPPQGARRGGVRRSRRRDGSTCHGRGANRRLRRCQRSVRRRAISLVTRPLVTLQVSKVDRVRTAIAAHRHRKALQERAGQKYSV